jgi:glycolate oxidase iron-sulfur subunit
MADKRQRDDFRELAKKCLRCGLCTIVCPVHQVEADEYTAARGRNLLANQLASKRDISKEFRKRFEKCLLCGSCLAQCPKQIPIDFLTLGVREEVVKQKGLGLAKKAVFRYAMKDRERFGKILAKACKLQRYLPAGEGKIRHLPTFLSGLGAGRRIPEIASVFLRDRVRRVSSPPSEAALKMRVGFFMGCALDYLFPEIGEKIIRFLNRQGVEVVTPWEQGCCSLPVLGSGDVETAMNMARKNVAAFQDLDLIVTGCATCGSALKDYGAFFGGEGKEGHEGWSTFAVKVKDFSEFLVHDLNSSLQNLPVSEKTGKREIQVTYHDPCHLSRYQGVTEEPRKIISSIPGVRLTEMEGADLCCGMGGSFGLSYYDTSRKIGDKKARAIKNTGAEAVITTCPGCRMQIMDALKRNGMGQQVLHIAELLEPDGE